MTLHEQFCTHLQHRGTIFDEGELTVEDPLMYSLVEDVENMTGNEALFALWTEPRLDGSEVLYIKVGVATCDLNYGGAVLQERLPRLNRERGFGVLQLETFKGDRGETVTVYLTESRRVHGAIVDELDDFIDAMHAAWSLTRQHVLLAKRTARRMLLEEPFLPQQRSTGAASVQRELRKMVGLAPVKRLVTQLAAQHQMSALRRAEGLKPIAPSPHLVFTGNPGTGKTTVARFIGELYRSLGLLSKGHVVEVGRADLVGAYIGHSAVQTTAACKRALGGVLFIDEAYSLAVDGRDFGAEVVQTLLAFMENHRDEIVVIVAGYPGEMQRFLASNDGLRSRFDVTIDFPDYSDDELMVIFERLAADSEYWLHPEATDNVRLAIEAMPRGRAFGNARDIRRLFTDIVLTHATDIAQHVQPSKYAMQTILARHVPVPTVDPTPVLAASASGASTSALWPGYL